MPSSESISSGGSHRQWRRSLGRRMSYDESLPAELVDRLWRGDLDRLVGAATLLQTKDRCVVVRYDGPQGPLLVKRHVWGNWWRTMRMALREPSAWRSTTLGCELAEGGIRTPQPRAHVELCVGPLGYRSYLVTDFVDGPTLYHLARTSRLEPQLLAHLTRQVAHIWQRLIELGVSHNDLKPENFMIDRSQQVWLIDLEKVRFHRRAKELRPRHLADASRFLHVRTWRCQPAAADVFRTALLETTLGDWLAGEPTDSHPLLRNGYTANELAGGLSVVVRCQAPAAGDGLANRVVESVRDVADEILLVGPAATGGQWGKVCRVLRPTLATDPHAIVTGQVGRSALAAATQPWVLVLDERDQVVPELAREIQERMADRPTCDAFRIPVVRCASGHRVGRGTSTAAAPIRLFRQQCCTLCPEGAETNGSQQGLDWPTVAAPAGRVEQLTWPIRRLEPDSVAPSYLAGDHHGAHSVPISKAA